MNCVGLAESIVTILYDYTGFYLIDGGINDVRVYSVSKCKDYGSNYIVNLVVCALLQGIIFIGTEFESRTQVALFLTLAVSIASHIVGTFLPSNEYQLHRGVTGYSRKLYMDF
jgi:hypothetical protein